MKSSWKSLFVSVCMVLALVLPATAAVDVPDNPATNPDTVVLGQAPAGAPDLDALGAALCDAGIKSDARALIALFEPSYLGVQMEMLKQFSASMAEQSGEPVPDPLTMFIAEFDANMKENPLVKCTIKSTGKMDCPEEITAQYQDMEAKPAACGTLTMESQLKKDEAPSTDQVPVLLMDKTWFMVVPM